MEFLRLHFLHNHPTITKHTTLGRRVFPDRWQFTQKSLARRFMPVTKPFALLLAWLLLANPVQAQAQQAQPQGNGIAPELAQQRALYSRATRALSQGDRATFGQLKKQLTNYPLLPYLDYADLSSRLARATSAEVNAFLTNNAQTPLAVNVRQRWLTALAAKQQWQQFAAAYDDSLNSLELRCHQANALYHSGQQQQGIALALELWKVGKSQPKACDPMFAVLVNGRHISNDIAWQRFSDALLNHEYRLASFIERFFTDPVYQQRAQRFRSVDEHPENVGNYSIFSAQSAEESRIIAHGLSHLARIDAPTALKHWNRYHQSHPFDDAAQGEIVYALVTALFQGGNQGIADQYLLQSQDKATSAVMEWRLRELVKAADWPELVAWSGKIDAKFQAESRWRYWRARALELSGGDKNESQRLYQAVAGERSFYGFLASEWLQIPYSMQHEPVNVTPEQITELAARPHFTRSRELFYHNELDWARREWQQGLRGAPQQDWLTAAKLAQQWQWANQAINSMIAANYWNDIDVRFPQPHREAFLTQANATQIPANLLLALSRQESAFNASVTSPAGAKGLMQLMPATAKETARKHGVAYGGPGQLIDPDKNILIGSRYYKEMLTRFNSNRILATAAYNAGPGRVASWRKRTEGTLPFDAWIETIPFKETRNYVQNVLAFSIIYAQHLGLNVPMLSEAEKNTLL